MAYIIMSYAEIKKAINSDLSKPLDTLIKDYLANSSYGLSALNTKITGGKVPIVKSVQRGTYTISGGAKTVTVTINSVNPLKCLVVLDGVAHGGYSPYVSSLTSTTLTFSWISYANSNIMSWQVIEFY